MVASQETTLVGDVYCAETGEPIPNANIYFQGTSVGTTSNAEGSFFLRTNLNKQRILIVSAVGYHKLRFQVEPGIMAGVQVALNEKTSVLEEVYATPDDSYALAILAKVKKNNSSISNRPSAVQSPTETTELFVSDIGSRQLKKRLWKSLRAGMITADDSTLMLPLYVSPETGTRYHHVAYRLLRVAHQ